MTEYTGMLELAPGRPPTVSDDRTVWPDRHRTCWWWLRRMPDLLAGIVVVLVLLYLVNA